MTIWLEDRMQSKVYKKGRFMMTTLIVSGIMLTVWTALLVILNGMKWFPS